MKPIPNSIAAQAGELTEWRQDFHRHPELRFDEHRTSAKVAERLERFGLAPLPPYIRRGEPSPRQEALDRQAYQTCYASVPGAIAAPTAGLHFSPRVLAALRTRGIEMVEITLHVGAGTFSPVKTDNPELHQMHREWYGLE